MSTLLVYYRQDAAKQQTNFIIKFTHRPKNQVFRPREATHCTNSGQTSKGRRAPRSAWLCKISPQSAQGMCECGSKNIKNFHFLVKELPCRGEHLDQFLKFLGAFIRPTFLHQCFKCDVICFTIYGVIAEKPHVCQLGQIFPCTL